MVERVKRPKVEVETEGFRLMLVRLLRAYRKRVGEMDIASLKGMVEFADLAEQTVGETVAKLRSEEGGNYSWADIAKALGIPRSTAQHRYEKYKVPSE